jgi:heme exporter protein D
VSASTSTTSLFAKDSPAAQLFAAFPFSLPSERSLRRYKTAMLSRIRDSYINAPPPVKDTKRARSCCGRLFDGWYWAFALSVAVIGGAAVGLSALYSYLHDGAQPRIFDWWDSPLNPIFVPIIAALTRRVVARVVSDLARYEWNPLDYSREHRRSRMLWRIMFLETVFAAVPAYIAFTSSRATAVVPFMNRPSAVAQGVCVADSDSPDGFSCACDETRVGQVFYIFLVGELLVSLFTNVVGPLLAILGVGLLRPFITRVTARRWRTSIYGAVEPVRAMGEWAHRQILMWAGLPFAPVMAPLLAVGDMIILAGALPLTVKLAAKPSLALSFPVARQQQHSRICTLAMLLLSFVSVTIFMASQPTCGPFLVAAVRNLSISEYFNTLVDTAMPRWVAVAFEYLTNSVVLWLAVIVLSIYLLTISVQTRLLKQRKHLLELQLRAEERNKRLMIAKSALTIGLSQLEGKRLFEEWFSTLPPSLAPQRPALARLCAGDLTKFLRMTPEQLLTTFGRHAQLGPHARTLTQSILMMRLFANTPKEKVQ